MESNHLDTQRALLVGAYRNTKEKEACEESLVELQLLVNTFGIQDTCLEPVYARDIDAATFLTKGKLEECVESARCNEATLVIFDEEISPSQQRNLEKAFGISVIDRTEVILGVFAQRAQTKEARLQVELAQTEYQYPRLKRLWTHLSRQRSGGSGGSGGGYVKGEGEKQIELDRRILQNKIESLREELKEVAKHRNIQRAARVRSAIPTFAIVGYTNAGKSTLLNALTQADVLVEDKLFATLDTTTRKFTLPNNQEILLIDTVGFIRKLPHTLVDAFKSTLEESLHADILIHLIDISHPQVKEHIEATYNVLQQLKADQKTILTVFNKVDRASEDIISEMNRIYPDSLMISAITHQGFDDLMQKMVVLLKGKRKNFTLKVPQKEYATVSQLIRLGKILDTQYEDNDVILQVEVPHEMVHLIQQFIEQ